MVLKFFNPYVCILLVAAIFVMTTAEAPDDVGDKDIQTMTPPVGNIRPWRERDPRAYAAYLRAEESRINQARHGGR